MPIEETHLFTMASIIYPSNLLSGFPLCGGGWVVLSPALICVGVTEVTNN